jgi:uncharacterized damage-inducible protein DinB
MTSWNKDQILLESEKAFQQFTGFCTSVPDDIFFQQPGEKWSIAQNVQHLVTSTKTTTWAFALPKFMVRIVAGKPNRPSRTYEALVEKYKQKLAAGGKASGRYIPTGINDKAGKIPLINNWQHATAAYMRAVKNKWREEQLDEYIVPHPLLGKITTRELCYFTIYHTLHHLNNILPLRRE